MTTPATTGQGTGQGSTATPTAIRGEAARRRTFAVISHPDAGKSTLTEALALHANVIGEAGAVHGKAGRRGVVSDWMEMEKARGISITSAALQFSYRDRVVNLLDTPGHADFSEDTYRVLAAVDSAVMLVDAAKGLEPQTRKLAEVCRLRGVPMITLINKWDRPGRDALDLMDELTSELGLHPMPLNWPVGVAGDFRGLLDRTSGDFIKLTRTPGGASVAEQETIAAAQAGSAAGEAWTAATDEHELLSGSGMDFDADAYLAGTATPVLFGAAVINFGVRQLLDTLIDLAPAPPARPDATGADRPVTDPFSGFVFKIQAGMDANHRDRVAFVRVCSGRFERGMVVVNAATGRPFATKYAQTMFGRERTTVDTAFPGDVVGLVNATALNVGDTLYSDRRVTFPPMPLFAPEHFAVARAQDAGRSKQFRRGIDQLAQEGAVQVLRSDLRGEQAPVLAAVGPMQFDVVSHRMANEFSSPITLDHLPYKLVKGIARSSEALLSGAHGAEVLERQDGARLALFTDKYRMNAIKVQHPGLELQPLPGDHPDATRPS